MDKDKINIFNQVNTPEDEQDYQEKTKKNTEFQFESVSQATIISYLIS